MLKKAVLILLLSAVVLTGCQVTRTRKQAIFDPNINDKTRQCQQEECHPLKETDYYNKFRFSHNKHFASTDAKNCDACHNEKKHSFSLLKELKTKSYEAFRKTKQKGPIDLKLKFDSCRKCHGKKSPHGTWQEAKKNHAKEANADINSCSRCHQEKFCMVCHQVEIPHPTNWLKTHGPVTTLKGTKECVLCHSNKKSKKMDFCHTCHAVPMPHPKDIKESHGKLSKQVGVKNCYQCHDKKTFCNECHKTDMPHSKSFINNHFKEIRALTASSCVQCHDNKTSSLSGCFGGDCHTQK